MKIVIELSDETYKDIKEENGIYGINNDLCARITGKVVGAIQSGTPLPKGHGALKDTDAILKELSVVSSRPVKSQLYMIKQAQTLVEADKEESDADSN